MGHPKNTQTSWYGRFSLRKNAVAFWQVGPYQLWARRSENEWRVASLQGDDPLDNTLLVEVPSTLHDPPENAEVRRFGFQQEPETVTLTPALADRPVIVSPEQPLHLPPQERISLFISTPVWVGLLIGDASKPHLDQPTHRPTDTWFGPSTMDGELCYASRTAARMYLENLPVRPHRVITTVEVKNRSTVALTVEKLKIPTENLSVFASRDGNLWTETVTLEHQEEASMASVRSGKGAPKIAADATPVSGPRSSLEQGFLTRTFGGLMA